MREQFIVVGGSPRSGTSLLRTILRSSSALVVHKTEPHYVLELHRRFGSRVSDVPRAVEFLLSHDKFPRAEVGPDRLREELKDRTTLTLSEFLRTVYRLLRGSKPEAPVVLKHPAWLLNLDLIRELFPDLRVVHSIRDPRANAFSQRTRWPSTSLWHSATGWQAYIDAGRAWERRGITPYMELRYEDLVLTPERSCRTLCEHLGIPFEPALLDFDHVEREWNPANPGEGSKRHYDGFEPQRIDKWREFMKPVEVKLIEDQCHRGMALFGYERMNPPVSRSEYVSFYLRERRRALQKSLRRMRRRWRETPIKA